MQQGNFDFTLSGGGVEIIGFVIVFLMKLLV